MGIWIWGNFDRAGVRKTIGKFALELFDKKSVTGCEAGEVVTSMCDYYSIYAHHEFAMIDKRIQYSRKRGLQSSSQNIYTVRFGL